MALALEGHFPQSGHAQIPTFGNDHDAELHRDIESGAIPGLIDADGELSERGFGDCEDGAGKQGDALRMLPVHALIGGVSHGRNVTQQVRSSSHGIRLKHCPQLTVQAGMFGTVKDQFLLKQEA